MIAENLSVNEIEEAITDTPSEEVAHSHLVPAGKFG